MHYKFLPSRVTPTSKLPNSSSILTYVLTTHGLSSTTPYSLMVLWTTPLFFSEKILRLQSWILYIPNYNQSPSKGHYWWSLILCPNNLIYHSNFHYHKSSTNQIHSLYKTPSGLSFKMSFFLMRTTKKLSRSMFTDKYELRSTTYVTY